MLRPLLLLSAVTLVAGNADQTIDIRGCPITFYGKRYENAYVSTMEANAARYCRGSKMLFGLNKEPSAAPHHVVCGCLCPSASVSCVFDKICTVTGHTVINILGQMTVIEDRCSYSLLSAPSNPNFRLVGNFRERRRTDVSFLESVTLQLRDVFVNIHLEQGAKLNESVLRLNSSLRDVQGVMMSKDHRGVVAKVSLANSNVSIFFDGNTAQIRIQGPVVTSLAGLCGLSGGSPNQLTLPGSNQSCQTKHQQAADVGINCTAAAQRCGRLMQPPFVACHSSIDPQPFITACNRTLCRYPALDGLNCQFLEAYARACQLHDASLQSWRSAARCPSPEAFCQDRTCSAHEFCGEKTPGGDTRCFCRAIFASKYKSEDSLGEPTVCSESSATVSLLDCLLQDKGISYSTLHLNNDTCRGQMDEVTHMVTFSYNSSNTCGADVTSNSSKIFFTNTIKTTNVSSGVITRLDQVHINFSCVYTQPEIQFTSFRIKDSSVFQKITSGAWNYNLTMKAYSDPAHTQAVDRNTELQLNQKIWVELDTVGLEGGLVALVTDSCWATKDQQSNSTKRHKLIENGCASPGDQTVKVMGNGLGTSNSFSFNMFQFSGSSGEVYLHCKLQLCVKAKTSCDPVRLAANTPRPMKPQPEPPQNICSWTFNRLSAGLFEFWVNVVKPSFSPLKHRVRWSVFQ
uniref:ZP domain-containing protein n=1 Tax=Stegastes partitus TaxID=144197 RepID=A0A3B5AT48_9TELE